MIKNFTVIAQPRITDDHPFITLNIAEAESLTAPRETIDTQTWDDLTPSTVAPVEIETSEAQFENGYYWFQWIDDTGAETQWWGPVVAGGTSEFCTPADMLARLGLTEWATPADETRCQLLISLASSNIATAIGRDATSISPIPGGLRALCIELVARVMVNPTGARSESEQLGSYQYSTSYTDNSHGIALSDAEARAARRIVSGSGFQSLTMVSPYSGDADLDLV